MEYYCTLCDEKYLPKALALYESMQVVMKNEFTLYFLCMSEICFEEISRMKLEGVFSLSLSDIMTDKLVTAKGNRSAEELCWTCTSVLIKYILEHYRVPRCTYLDADICFFNNPQGLFEEMGDASSLIIEHRYTERLKYAEKTQGKFNVQFMPFKNDECGKEVLNWWSDKCLEWCYRQYEDGKMGDQLYLDCWPEKFEKVHILRNIGAGVAPWNAARYTIREKGEELFIKECGATEEINLVFYHFHGLKLFDKDVVKLTHSHYELPGTMISYVYKYYIRLLDTVIKKYHLEQKIIEWGSRDIFKSEDIDHLNTSHHYFNKSIFL